MYAYDPSSIGLLLKAIFTAPPAEQASSIADMAYTANRAFVISG